MQEVFDRLWVGDERACRSATDDWAVIHACKSPCHQRAVGYTGSLASSHPNYLVFKDGKNLFLNIIDPKIPLFMKETFVVFRTFADENWVSGKNVLIHCNLGESRAPSLALLFLAKSRAVISDSSYAAAKSDFTRLYPGYKPGQGLSTYLTQEWASL